MVEVEAFRQHVDSLCRNSTIFSQPARNGKADMGVPRVGVTIIFAEVVKTFATRWAHLTPNMDFHTNFTE
ncbi:unnamed protein product [marine sediment metagenome]|uniref:Uncharacterized protein n=1 Tax=marine sediment metagenome TaxID=412755 RepID=X1ETM6_9ZZZZ